MMWRMTHHYVTMWHKFNWSHVQVSQIKRVPSHRGKITNNLKKSQNLNQHYKNKILTFGRRFLPVATKSQVITNNLNEEVNTWKERYDDWCPKPSRDLEAGSGPSQECLGQGGDYMEHVAKIVFSARIPARLPDGTIYGTRHSAVLQQTI